MTRVDDENDFSELANQVHLKMLLPRIDTAALFTLRDRFWGNRHA